LRPGRAQVTKSLAEGVTVLLITGVTLASCLPDRDIEAEPCPGESADAPFTQRDSAGVQIVETACEISTQPIGWIVDREPELVIGVGDGPEEEFAQVAGVSSLPDRGVAVVDQEAFELRYFDAEGSLTARMGGEGQGPREFLLPQLIPAPDLVDSILVGDSRLRQYRHYPARPGGEHRVVWGGQQWTDRARQAIGKVNGRILSRPERVVAQIIQTPGPNEEELPFYWIDTHTGEETLLERHQATRTFTLTPRGVRIIPFAEDPSSTVGPSGPVITSGGQFEIRHFDLDGDLHRILRIDRRRSPITDALVRDYADWRVETGRSSPERAEALSDIPTPDSLPAFSALQVDAPGWIWAQIVQPNPRLPTSWMVFDPDGRGQGLVEVPAGLEVHEIGEDFILGTWEDEWRRQQVHRYRLIRNR